MKKRLQFSAALLIVVAITFQLAVCVRAANPGSVGSSADLYGSELPPDLFDEDCDGGSSCPGRIFTDMPPANHWSHVPIDWALTHHVTTGTSPSKFSPSKECNRAQAVTFLWRSNGSPEPESVGCPFVDVPVDAYYYKAVLWAVENQITSGTSKTTFSPGKVCTRAQIVTFLWRAAGKPSASGSQEDFPFRDVSASAYYRTAVAWATGKGITNGMSQTAFCPDLPCTRAQIVTFLYRAIHG